MIKKTQCYFIIFLTCAAIYFYGIYQPLSRAIMHAKKITLQNKNNTQRIALPSMTQSALWPLLPGIQLQRLQSGSTKHLQGWWITPLTCELRGSFSRLEQFVDHSPLPIEHLRFTAKSTETVATLVLTAHKADDNTH